MKKRWIAAVLTAMLLLSLCACGENGGDAPAETTEVPEVLAAVEIVKGGVSDYVIVHDGSVGASKLATSVCAMISGTYGVTLAVKSTAQAEDTKKILVGNVDAAGQSAMRKLAGEFDFTLRTTENTLALCAKDDLSYNYLEQYLKREVFVKGESADLILTPEDTMLYSQSPLMDINFVNYWLEENTYFPFEEHFAYKIFENDDTKLPYRIYIPFNYDPQKSYPLLLNLHGAGLRGEDNQKHLKFIDHAMKNPELGVSDAIVVFPQCPESDKWVDSNWSLGSYSLDSTPESNELKAVMELIGQLQESYSIDDSRVYAMGFSMGGYGTWNLLMNHPDVFAAGIPMCGAGDPTKASAIKDIPIWAVHGALDPTVPVAGSRDMAAALENAGAADFHYTELPDAEHDVWNYTYANTEIWQWLFSRKKA